MTGQHAACGSVRLGTQSDCVARPLATQIQVAVAQSRLLTRGLVELEWQRRALVEHLQFGGVDFDLPGRDLVVGVTFGPDLHNTGDLDAEFRAQPVSLLQHRVLAEHDLGDTRRVAQIDEDDAAVIASARHPAGKRHSLPGVRFPQRTGVMSAQHERSLRQCLFHRKSVLRRLSLAARVPHPVEAPYRETQCT
ncbi:Uncharacterised protein [Mycobacteroides abscessus subsp. abscessus]|nr:Uncharacterised protein [Mycobacteroides abscessus subsp. abscessus]